MKLALTFTEAIEKQEIPKIKAILAMLEPTIVPMATDSKRLKIALTATNNSGIDVPNATIVKPIKNSFTPKYAA